MSFFNQTLVTEIEMLKVVVLFLVCRNRRKKKKMYASYYGADSRTGSTKSPTVMYIVIRVDKG
jgi:hypothetical protein